MPSKPKPAPPKPTPTPDAPPDEPLGLAADPAPGVQDGPAAASPTPPTTPESSPPAIIAPAAVQKAPPRQDAAPQCPACGDVSMTAYHSGPLKTYYRCPECGRTDQRIRSAVLVQLNRRGRV